MAKRSSTFYESTRQHWAPFQLLAADLDLAASMSFKVSHKRYWNSRRSVALLIASFPGVRT